MRIVPSARSLAAVRFCAGVREWVCEGVRCVQWMRRCWAQAAQVRDGFVEGVRARREWKSVRASEGGLGGRLMDVRGCGLGGCFGCGL